MTSLYPHLPFRADETPLSWVARLAMFHSGQRVVPFVHDQKLTIADVTHGRACAIDRLCAATGEDPGPVWRNTAIRHGPLSLTLRGEPLLMTMMLRQETRFCPLCLAEDDAEGPDPHVVRRGRLAWSLRIVTTCPVHRLPLVARRRGVWDDMMHELSVLVPETTEELRALADELSPATPSALQSYVLNRLEGQAGPAWLDGQSLGQVVKATEMLGVTMLHGPRVRLGGIERSDWEVAANEGWKWVSRGEDGVRDALSRLQAEGFDRGMGGRNYGSVFGHLYGWLRDEGSDHGPMRSVVRDYIVDNMEVVIGQDLFGEEVGQRKNFTVKSVAELMGVKAVTLRNLLVARGQIARADAETSCAILLLDAPSAIQLGALLENTLGMAEAAAHLGATRQIVDELIGAGRLLPLHDGNGRRGRLSCRLPLEQVEAIASRLEEVAVVRAVPPEGWVNLTTATKKARITTGELLEMILAGELGNLALLEKGGGFAAIRLDPAEIRSPRRSAA